MTPFDAIDLITKLRGGHPPRCDFCGKLYTKKRIPYPEEAGTWACNECYQKWDAEQAMKNVK